MHWAYSKSKHIIHLVDGIGMSRGAAYAIQDVPKSPTLMASGAFAGVGGWLAAQLRRLNPIREAISAWYSMFQLLMRCELIEGEEGKSGDSCYHEC